jgi:hypothetical protein
VLICSQVLPACACICFIKTSSTSRKKTTSPRCNDRVCETSHTTTEMPGVTPTPCASAPRCNDHVRKTSHTTTRTEMPGVTPTPCASAPRYNDRVRKTSHTTIEMPGVTPTPCASALRWSDTTRRLLIFTPIFLLISVAITIFIFRWSSPVVRQIKRLIRVAQILRVVLAPPRASIQVLSLTIPAMVGVSGHIFRFLSWVRTSTYVLWDMTDGAWHRF